MAHLNMDVPECCGIFELADIHDTPPVECVYGYLRDFFEFGYPDRTSACFVNFTSTEGSGDKLAAYIKRHKLGIVKFLGERFNDTGSSNLRGWCWMPCDKLAEKHTAAIKRYYRKETENKNWLTDWEVRAL